MSLDEKVDKDRRLLLSGALAGFATLLLPGSTEARKRRTDCADREIERVLSYHRERKERGQDLPLQVRYDTHASLLTVHHGDIKFYEERVRPVLPSGVRLRVLGRAHVELTAPRGRTFEYFANPDDTRSPHRENRWIQKGEYILLTPNPASRESLDGPPDYTYWSVGVIPASCYKVSMGTSCASVAKLMSQCLVVRG